MNRCDRMYDDAETITAYEEGVAEGLRQAFRLAKSVVIRYRSKGNFPSVQAELIDALDKHYKSQLETVAEMLSDGYEDVE